ncbi:Galactan beta-1,4-galactosyltransferase GALS2 [Camellia lanceoleosa]|uniref:Galactan beta-1,4-galactosyltransferase GALS2 n=1 Tax=Camellia lanceoleosa TaxID=1840588 RepID=A0ACC0HLQ9_9ERIC|nr:Galactan beta-1,4-galactosyltransferase GALS2 [Camellia lanceoleosa]
MFIGFAWNCAADLKFLITALLFVCSIATILQFLPSRFSFSSSSTSSDFLRNCLPKITLSNSSTTTITTAAPPPLPPPPTPSSPDEMVENGIIKRNFNPYGNAAYNFVLMSAYRGELNTFAIMGLFSKPLYVFANAAKEKFGFLKEHNYTL